jgi:ribosomal peptide maturation radical SAM protein 1
MFRIALVNPPFAALSAPSFALTQLRELLRTGSKKEHLEVSVHYLNIDFAQYLGQELYNFIAGSMDALNSGVGEWMFRQIAFPDVPDNADQFYRRYYHHLRRPDGKSWWNQILEKRTGVNALLETLLETHGLYQSDLVGFTSMFAQNVPCFALAKKLKLHNPNIVTVMGGANCETSMGEEIIKRVEVIDYVFSGPALVNFPQFVDYYIEGEFSKCAALDGVFPSVSRRGAAVTVPHALNVLGSNSAADAVPKASIGKELDIDFKIDLDYNQFLDTVYRAFPEQVSPLLFFETSRGCWWGEKAHCTFCGLNGTTMKYRAMSSTEAIEQFRSLFKYSDRVVELHCVDNIMPKQYLKDVLPFLETPSTMRIFYEVKVDLSKEDLGTLSDARVKRIQPGIESLATSTLKLMRKGTTAHQNVQFLKHCALHGIEPSWNLLIGFPGEQEDVYKKYIADLPALVHLPPPSGVFPVRFDRFSPYFMRAAEYDLKLRPLEFYELVYPFPAEALMQLAYFFTDENVFASYTIAVGEWITRLRGCVQAWRDRWNNAKVGIPPRLCFEDPGSSIIIDTRSGQMVKHDVRAAGRAFLECLSKPRKVEDVVRQLARSHNIDIDAELRSATEKALVFQEDGRLVSLLLPNTQEEDQGDISLKMEKYEYPANDRV